MRPAGIYKSHDLMTYISWSTDLDFGQIIKVKICVQGRISKPINGHLKDRRTLTVYV